MTAHGCAADAATRAIAFAAYRLQVAIRLTRLARRRLERCLEQAGHRDTAVAAGPEHRPE